MIWKMRIGMIFWVNGGVFEKIGLLFLLFSAACEMQNNILSGQRLN